MTTTLELIAACLAEEEGLYVHYDDRTHLEDGAGYVMAYPVERKAEGGTAIDAVHVTLIYVDQDSGHIAAVMVDSDAKPTLFELANPECWTQLKKFILAKPPGVSFGVIPSSTPTER